MPQDRFEYPEGSVYEAFTNLTGRESELLSKFDFALDRCEDRAADLARDLGFSVEHGQMLLAAVMLYNLAGRMFASAEAIRLTKNPAFDFDPVEFGKFAERVAVDVVARTRGKMRKAEADRLGAGGTIN